MGGNTFGESSDGIQYAIRITFGIVHGVLLTLCSFGLILLFPSFSRILFALFGCIFIPILSFFIAVFCNGCIEYVSQSTLTVARILKTAWIPPFGVFCVNSIILPLEFMPSLKFTGPINTLVMTSIVANCILTAILQIYAARDIQVETASVTDSSKSSGTSDPT